MFTNTNRTGFGGNATFGNPAPANPFGTSQMFGATTSTFGSPAFGQAPSNVFGAPAQPQNQLFSSANTSTFGTPAQNAFGSTSLFGQQTTPASSSLFTSSTFGQQNKQPGYSFPTPQTGLFGQATAQPQQTTMFQPSTSSTIFGASSGGFGMPVQSGTTVKFQPVTGTDSMQKSGSTTVINTKHHCITCMKEYENKSFEELRMEDYAANRKGPQQGASFGAQPFASTANTGIFGQTENKATFGQTNTFGAPAPAFGGAASTASNIFGKPAFGGTTTSTSGFGSFGAPQQQQQQQPASNIFGAPQQNKPFGQAAPLFGSQPQQSSFGATPLFGQSTATQAQSSFFNKPAQPTFSTPQTGFSFGQPAAATQSTGLFQAPKTTGFSLFNTTTTTATSAWPQTNTFGANAFAKPAQPAFGQTAQPSFGTGLQMPQNNLFGSLGAKPAFGTQPTSNLFGTSSMLQAPSCGMQQPAQQPVTLNTSSQLNDLRTMIANCDPYGYSPHLDNLGAFKPVGTHYVTNPKDIDNYLKETENNISNATPKARKIQVKSPCPTEKWKMFEASYDNGDNNMSTTFNKSVRRLDIRRDSSLKKPEPIYVVQNGRLVETSMAHSQENTPISSPAKALQITTSKSSEGVTAASPVSTTFTVTKSTPDLSTKKPSQGQTDPSIQEFVSNVSCGTDTNVDGVASTSGLPRMNVGVVDIDTLEDTTQQKFLSSTEVTDTCGIICTRPQYYTLPALDKVSQFKATDGSCFIKGFTIGRHGYGNVHFPDVMNVANLNIDELVHFCHKQICIYLDDSTKPPVGEGLNRPAQVTLDRVFPSKDPKSHDAEQDSTNHHSQAMAEVEFEEVLRRACQRAGTTFVDYRPETGSWVFNVYHFSKYDLLDPDEADIRREALDQQNKDKEKDTSDNRDARDNSGLEKQSAASVEFLMKRGLGGVAMETESRTDRSFTDTGASDSAVFLNSNMEYQSQQMFGGSRWEQDRIPKRNMQLMQMKYMFYSDDPLGRDKSDQVMDEDMDDASVLEVSDTPETSHLLLSEMEDRPKSTVSPDIYVLRNVTKRVPMNKSLLVNRGVIDAAIFKGRSFKCGWGAGLKMYALNGARISEIQASQVPIDMEQSDCDPFSDHSQLDKFMELIHTETALQLEHGINGETIPLFQMIETRSDDRYQTDEETLLSRLFKLSENIAGKHSRNKHMAYYHSVWKLMVAFWDTPTTRTNVAHFRRDMFNQWLEHVTSPIVNRLLGNESAYTPAQNLLTCLSGHKIHDAIKLAASSGHPQLSLLIAQLNAPSLTRYCIQHQLNHWQTTGALEFITNDMRRLYMIVAGTVTYGDVNVLEGLDWLRCLAIYFWYICPSSKNVEVALSVFADAFDKSGHAAKPTSKYATIQDTWDILYHIMRLYCTNQNSLEILLSPQTHTSDPNDYRLSWLLQQVFQSMGVGIISDECHNQTTTSFATQLEDYEQYKWAIFVLLHLKDIVVRKNLVMGVLDRQLGNMDTELEEHIVDSFHIPATWLHEVKAAKTQLLNMHWQAYKHLCYSGQFFDAHDLLIRELSPTLVSNHEFDILNNLLEEIEGDRLQITRWKYQGGLIMQFIRFWKIMHDFHARQDVPTSEVNAIQMELNQLLTYLRSYSASDYKQVLVVAEMSKYCASFYTTLMKFMRTSEQDVCELNNQFNMVVMPFDYKYAEINKFIGYSKRR